ncbi:MAG: leucine-rich repeat domain-containing protein [Paludibacter sp.]|nr:leucine-rich repeat domain-containing protein [Paludibacter sp.]
MKKNPIILCVILFALSTNALAVSKTINLTTAGTLSTSLTAIEKITITNLTLSGNVDARDVKCMSFELTKLSVLDLSDATIKSCSSGGPYDWVSPYPANEMPAYSFSKRQGTGDGPSTYNGKKTLTSIKLPTSITSIGESAFVGCSGLTGITITNSVTKIGNETFEYCSGLIGTLIIPNSVTSIGSSSFSGCTGLTGLTIGSSVSTLSYSSFSGCTNIKVVNSLNSTPPTVSGSIGLNSNTLIYVPSSSLDNYKVKSGWTTYTFAIEKRVTIINPTAGSLSATIISAGFSPLSSITHLTITGNLNSVDISQIKTNMTVLTELDLTGTTLINNILPDNAFTNKSTLTVIKFPATLESIGISAFYGTSLSGNLILPASITSIGNNAFMGLSGLSGSLSLPNTLNDLGDNAFQNCGGLTGNLLIPSSLMSIGTYVFSGCSGLNGSLSIPNSVISIGNYAFQNCTNLTGSLSIGNTVTSIGDYAFSSCSGLSGGISIPNSITSIGSSAFQNCTSLTGSLTLGNSVISIGDYAFSGCSGLTGDLLIPSTINTIGSYSFQNCAGLTGNLTIPNSVNSIGSYAFQNCTGFTGNLSLSNSLTIIDSYVFSGCSNLSGVLNIPISVISVSANAFGDCIKFTQLYINKNTTTISDNAFKNCSLLSKISISRTIPPTIYTNTFSGVNKETCTLEIPINSSANYQTANYWSQFIFLSESILAETYGITIQIGINGIIKENNVVLGNGSVLTADKNSVKTFTFIPNQGYEIATLTFNGVDVKSQLSNNQYTTGAINANSTLNVTFSKAQYRLSIKDASTGTVNLICEYGAKPSFDFTPSTDWKVNTVFYNSIDVTSSLVNGIYTVPSITSNTLLNVSFVSTITGAPELINNRLKVYSVNSEIIVEGTSEGETVTLYTVNGKQIQTFISNGEKLNITADRDAVYLVKTGAKTFKVIL